MYPSQQARSPSAQARNDFPVPDKFFKAILRRDEDDTYNSIAFVFENDSSRQPLKDAVITVDDLEALIGQDLFTILDDMVETVVESQVSWADWQ